MSDFFTDTMTGLLQAIAIEKGEIPVSEVPGMPSKTYRAKEDISPYCKETYEDMAILKPCTNQL